MRFMWWLWMIILPNLCLGQKKWDGGAGTKKWEDPANWYPDGIPARTDTVLLDNSFITDHYRIELPSGNVPIEVVKMIILPSKEKEIIVEIPSSSTSVPALFLSDQKEGLYIETGGVFINASTAPNGNPLQLNGKMRLQQLGRYIHRTNRGNSDIIGNLSTAAGTEKGIVEFDIPGTTTYVVSLSGKTFGTLIFSSPFTGTKNYQSSGSSNCKIRGDLIIGSGVKLNSLLTSNIYLSGNLELNGTLSMNPGSSDSTGRSIYIIGNNAVWKGNGRMELNQYFRQIFIDSLSKLTISLPIKFPFETNAFLVKGMLSLTPTSALNGIGSFKILDGGGLIISNAEGICKSCPGYPITLPTQSYSTKGNYHFISSLQQKTGIDFPDSVNTLLIQNASGIVLNSPLYIRDTLTLKEGILWNEKRLMVDGGKIKSYHNAYIAGMVNIRLPDLKTHVIPLGNETRFAPVFVRNLSGTNNIQINFSIIQKTDPAESLHYWSAMADQKLFIGTIPQKSDSINGSEEMITWIHEGSSWILTETKKVNVNDVVGLENTNALSGNFKITIGQQKNILLPIESIKISGLLEDQKAKIHISIKGEGDKIFIQTSFDGRNFKTIDSIIGLNKTSYVTWTDKMKIGQTTYFRIQFHNGEAVKYSNIIKFLPRNAPQVKIYPNPAREKISIFSCFPCSTLNYIIVNRSGAIVRKLRSNDHSLDIRDLASGSYLLQIAGCEQVITLPFTKN